jgi:hypothetical protein
MGNEFGTPTDVLVQRLAVIRVGAFDADFGTYLNDWDLWIRLAETGKVAFLSEKLAYVRRHEGQIGAGGARNNRDIDANMMMLEKRFVARPLFRSSLMVHFAAEFLRRALIGLLKQPSSQSVTYVSNTVRKVASHVGVVRSLLAILYIPTVLQYLRVRHFLIHAR